jgi:hypothetical protein
MAHSDVPVVIPTEVIAGLHEEVPTEIIDEGALPPAEEAKPEERPTEEPQPRLDEITPTEEPDEMPESLIGLIHDNSENTRAIADRLERALTPGPTPEAPPDVPPAIKALLESENPNERALGEQLYADRMAMLADREQDRARLAELEAEVGGTQQVIATAQAQAEIAPVAAEYGLSVKQVDYVTDMMIQSGAVNLTFEQGVRAFLPAATSRTRGAGGPQDRVAPRQPSNPPAVLDRPAASGAVPREDKSRVYDSVEDAVSEGFDRIILRGGA